MDWDRANGSFFTAILIAHCPKLEGECSDYKATNGFCALQLLFTTCPTTGNLTKEKTFESVSYSFCCILVYFLPPRYQRATSCNCYCPGNQPSSPSFSGASPLTIRGRLRGKPKSAALRSPSKWKWTLLFTGVSSNLFAFLLISGSCVGSVFSQHQNARETRSCCAPEHLLGYYHQEIRRAK